MRTKLLRTATLLAGFLWLAIAASAQERSVEGTVFEGDGKTPLVGVTVIVKGAPNRGTVTGADGRYSIRAKEGEELTYTYLGYEEVTLRIGGGEDPSRRDDASEGRADRRGRGHGTGHDPRTKGAGICRLESR